MSHKQGFRWISLRTRLAIYSRDDWRCLACGRKVTWRKGRGKWTDHRPTAASLDHVTPRCVGGSNAPSNLITLCVGCNSARADVPIGAWRPELLDTVAIAVSTPIDRAMGRALADELDPAFGERMRAKDRGARRRARSTPPPSTQRGCAVLNGL